MKTLTGTEKQIAWASDIREQMSALAATAIPRLEALAEEYTQKLEETGISDYKELVDDHLMKAAALRRIGEISDAEWFIENRKWAADNTGGQMLAIEIAKHLGI